MKPFIRVVPAVIVLALAGCNMGPTGSDVASGPMIAPPTTLQQPGAPVVVEPTVMAATSETALTDVTSFIDAGVIGKLSPKEKAEAANAQYNALTYGRPGAPRSWAGDRGATGQVIVGPYVRVNNIDCRDFTHTVTLAGGTFSKKGTACRDSTGVWSVS